MPIRSRAVVSMLASLLGLLSVASGCASPAIMSGEASEHENAPALSLMTFNLRYANPDDGDDFWDRRTALVFDLIRRHAPDVVGLQEALPRQMDALRAAFPDYRFLGQGRDGGDRGEFSALMVRAERLAVTDSGDFWLSPTPDAVASRGWDAALPRMCTWAVLRDRVGGAPFLVMNTHFDHRGARARAESARVLLERRARHAELPVVLLGDLNAGEDSAPLDVLREGGLRDTFRDAHPDADVAGTFNGFRGRSDGAKIDYVMVDDGWATLAAAIVRDHADGRYPSDHYPVIATIARR